MRSAGCVINDFADRDIDPDVARTCSRPIAAGLVKPREALILFAALCGIAFLLVLQLNILSIKLSFVAVFLAASYPFMKRITHLPQAYLGMAFGWSIPMAFAAQSGQLPAAVWLLFVANIFWTIAYDTMYAMVDRDDDILIGIKSSAILFGRHDRLIVALLQLLTLFTLWLTGHQFGLGWPYHIALLVIAGLFCYQQYLIRERHTPACFKAFLHNNWVGLALFAGVALHYAL